MLLSSAKLLTVYLPRKREDGYLKVAEEIIPVMTWTYKFSISEHKESSGLYSPLEVSTKYVCVASKTRAGMKS